jgi:hypothetical protein
MGIQRFNEFPGSSGSLTNDDIFLFMDNPGSSGVTKKISLTELSASLGSSSASLPASGLSITLGGGWYPPGFMPIFNYVVAQAFGFGSTYTKYTGKWISGSFSYSEGGYVAGTRLTSLTFNDLEGITGAFSPSNCAALTTINTGALAYTGGFSPSTLSACTSISCPNLVYVAGNFTPTTIASLTSLSCPSLAVITGNFQPTTPSSLAFSFPSLAYIGGGFTVNGAAGTWSFPALSFVGSFSINGSTPSTISFPALATVGSISLTNITATSISLPALAYCTSGISNTLTASNLTSFTLPVDGTLKLMGGAVNFSAGTVPLTQASVDNILQALASLDGTNGTTSYTLAVTLSATSCAAPSNSGSTTTAGSNFICSGTTCTVNWTGHGYATGDVLRVSGITTATNANKYAVITVVNANQFTYTITSQTATGAGTATVVKAATSAKTLVTRGVTLTTN